MRWFFSHRKRTLCGLAFVFLPGFLFADPASVRGERKIEIVAFPFLRPYASFSYNATPQFAYGMTILGGLRRTSRVSSPSCWAPGILFSACEKTSEYSSSGFAFFHYHPGGSPFFLSLVGGRGAGETITYNEIFSVDPSSLRLSEQAPVRYSITPEASYFLGFGPGFRWNFSGGWILGGEALFSGSDRRGRVYVSQDWRGLLPGYSPLSPADIWYYQKALEYSSSPSRYHLNLMVYAGFGF